MTRSHDMERLLQNFNFWLNPYPDYRRLTSFQGIFRKTKGVLYFVHRASRLAHYMLRWGTRRGQYIYMHIYIYIFLFTPEWKKHRDAFDVKMHSGTCTSPITIVDLCPKTKGASSRFNKAGSTPMEGIYPQLRMRGFEWMELGC